MQPNLDSLRIKIFADGADRKAMVELYRNPRIKGFTTNPTLMRKDGVSDYEHFAREVLAVIRDRPISFEVLSDDMDEMERQARKIVSPRAKPWPKGVPFPSCRSSVAVSQTPEGIRFP